MEEDLIIKKIYINDYIINTILLQNSISKLLVNTLIRVPLKTLIRLKLKYFYQIKFPFYTEEFF